MTITLMNGKLRIIGEPASGARIESDLYEKGDKRFSVDMDSAIDGIESLLLALFCNRVIVQSEDPRWNEAISNALEACENHLG